jgi:hypothetical protein
VLADFDVIVFYPPESVSIGCPRKAFTSGCRPRRGRYKKYDPFPSVIPSQYSLRMTARSAARVRASGDDGVIVELVVPNNIVERATIDFIESRVD